MRWMLLLLLVCGCGSPAKVVEVVDVSPVGLGGTECAVCGMTVADQASPRGQVVHRNGAHKHFCSIGDLIVYLNTPGLLGDPTGIWVEALPVALDPAAHDTAEQAWIPAADGIYAITDNRRVMGTPVLSYAKGAAPRSPTLDWPGLRTRLKP